MITKLSFCRFAAAAWILGTVLLAGPAPAASLVPEALLGYEELLIEAEEACDELRGRERRRCLRKVKSEAKAQAARLAALAPVVQAYGERWVVSLADEGTPRALALAAALDSDALLSVDDGPDDADAPDRSEHARGRAWRDAALEAVAASGHDDPVVLLLAYAASGDDPALRRALIARWRRADLDNLQPILAEAALDRAERGQVPADKTPLSPAQFAAAAQAVRDQSYFSDLQRLAVEALRRHPPTDAELQVLRENVPDFHFDGMGLALGLSLWTATSNTGFVPLLRSCEGEALDRMPTRREDCRRIGMRMVDHGDTLIGQLFGVALLRKAATTAEERERTRALRQGFDWRSRQVRSALTDASALGDAQAWVDAQIARLMQDGMVTESQVIEAGLQALGLPIEPPPCWDSGFRFPDEREPEAVQEADQGEAAEPPAGNTGATVGL